jgi:hypothetical protein
MNSQSAPVFRRLLAFYYAATIVFVILDYGFNVNVRIAGLEAYPGLRAGYYIVIFACLGLVLWRPAWSTAIGVVESLTTLVTLIMNVALRSMIVTDQMLETGVGFVTTAEIVNFVISGSIAWYSWQRGMSALFRPRD